MYNALMEIEPLIKHLNEKTQNKYKFSLKSAILDSSADFCVIEILYQDGVMLNLSKKDEVISYALELLPKAYKYEINFIKNFISEERITEDFSEFMRKKFASVAYELESVKLENKKFTITFKIDELSLDHIKEKGLSNLLYTHFKNLYSEYEYAFIFTGGEVYKIDETKLLKQNYSEEEVDIFEKRKIEVSEIISLVGEEIKDIPCYIKDFKSPKEKITFCGKIRDIKEIVIKRKPKSTEQDNLESNENITNSALNVSDETLVMSDNIEAEQNLETQTDNSEVQEVEKNKKPVETQRRLYKFTLEDFTDSVSCVFFSNKENRAKLEKLEAGSEVIVSGELQEDSFSGGVSLKVKELGYCKLPETFEEYIVYRKEKPFYEFVEPEPYIEYKQDDLMSFMNTAEVPEYLKDKTFVCFDFETTGLNFYEGDKIVEIGAVKIVNGVITEKFESFVNPEGKKSDPKAQETHKISEEVLVDAPLPVQVLQDFYKFTRGAILTGYNIANFDMNFLRGEGKRCRWNFDNEVVDTIDLARKYVHGVKKYNLGTIAEHLGVKLDRAHRAIYDTIATAEVFIILSKNIVS